MTSRRDIADGGRVVENPDGSRTIYWSQDGISRTYSKETIAGMFLEAIERGVTNPILEQLVGPEEMRQMYAELVELAGSLATLGASSPS